MRAASVLQFSMTVAAAGLLTFQAPAVERFAINGVTAHRGDSLHYPENTLAAFTSAIEAGVDWIEADVVRTLDGKLVVCHDLTTGRLADQNLEIGETDYETVRQLDMAAKFREARGLTEQECPRQPMPSLEEVLRLMMRQSRTRLSIQPKVDCVEAAISLINKLDASRWVGFNDGSLKYMKEVKRLAPSVPVFWDRGETEISEDIAVALEEGFEALIVNAGSLTAAKAHAVRAAGLELGVWTVNGKEDWERFLDLGVRRIYTDDPAGLLRFQRERGFGFAACEGVYPMHLQGICTDGRDFIYWSWTDALVKTDLQGRLLAKTAAANHHGDVCYDDGKIYCAVNLGKFNRPAGEADSWVYVYDANSLVEVARHKVPELVHGAGGIGSHGGRFVVVGGLPPGIDENYVYEYDVAFRFQKRHSVTSGYTLMGIQTATYSEGEWWFGCYGKPQVLLRTDEQFRLSGRWNVSAAVGLEMLSEGRVMVAENEKTGRGNHAWARLARADKKSGLIFRSR